MKALINKIFLFLSCSLFLLACKKDEVKVVATDGTSPQLTVVQTKQVMLEEQKADTAISFSWTKPDFGYAAAVNYSLQFAKKDAGFANPKTVALSNALQKEYTVAELNAIANEIGLEGFVEQQMEVRVKAEISSDLTPAYSNVSTITITPYLSEPEYPVVYMVGDATEGEWDNTKGTPTFRDENDAFVYTYTGYFKAGGLKILGYLGAWAPQWGSNGSGGATFKAKDADPDPANFTVATSGYYTLTLSLRNTTFSMVPYDASTAPVYSSIGIIGEFNSWSDIVPMTASAMNPHIWSITQTFNSDTPLKFRIAANWDVNWGVLKGKESEIRGKAVRDNENLSVKAGSYKIIFNDITGHYVFIKQ